MSQYERLKAKGIDFSWYERGKASSRNGAAVPLDDEECHVGSVYLMKADGTLWTLDQGSPHKKVRATGKAIPRDVYVCAHTKVSYDAHEQAIKHAQCTPEEVI